MIATYNPDGTPSDETLYMIEAWEGQYTDLAAFLCETWSTMRGIAMYDHGQLLLDTGGTPNNELLIEALKANEAFWQMSARAQMGNRYYFRIM